MIRSLIASAFILATSVAHAEPISASIAAVAAAGSVGAAVTTSAVGAFLINGAIGVAVSLGLTSLARPSR